MMQQAFGGAKPSGSELAADAAGQFINDHVDWSGHGGHVPGTPLPPKPPTYAELTGGTVKPQPQESIPNAPQENRIAMPLARPTQQIPIPPATDGFTGNVQINGVKTMPDDEDLANPRRKRSTPAFTGF